MLYRAPYKWQWKFVVRENGDERVIFIDENGAETEFILDDINCITDYMKDDGIEGFLSRISKIVEGRPGKKIQIKGERENDGIIS